jgi:hypothetical protein
MGPSVDDYHNLITSLSKDKVKEALHEQFDFYNYEIKDLITRK